jgi:hypothetical protein
MTPHRVDTRAQTAADELDNAYPGSSSQAEVYLDSLWQTVIDICKLIPASDVRMSILVNVLAKLKTKNRKSLRIWGNREEAVGVWKDLPLLGPKLREA